MCGLQDVEWLFSNSYRRIALSSEELLKCRSGQIVIRDFLTDVERDEYRQDKARLELLHNNVKQLEESEK